MAEQSQTAVLPAQAKPQPARMWNVVLLDDDEHTYDYVMEMLRDIFKYDLQMAYKMACEVDQTGRVIVFSAVLEQAELKRDQIHAYGADPRLERSRTGMRAVLEPAP